jgi:hypothetical protein
MNKYLYPGFCPEGLNIESMHITSKKDSLYMFSNEYLYFDRPKLIMHDKGHMAPKHLGTPGDMTDLKKFHKFFTR